MVVLPPGTLLQLMYLRERLRRLPPGNFIEIGPGSGEVTRLLLDLGWEGCSYDLEPKTISSLKTRFAKEIIEYRFKPIEQDYLLTSPIHEDEKVNLVISCMVMEHLEDDAQIAYMHKSMSWLKNEGIMIGLVPASPAHWGIEDDIAGHCRRYTKNNIEKLVSGSGWKLLHTAGLTFPLSNFLLPVSNLLVNRSERKKLSLSALERTKQSGRRTVRYKTNFPMLFGLLLNEYTLYPVHLIQKMFTNSKKCLVLFFEASPNYKGND